MRDNLLARGGVGCGKRLELFLRAIELDPDEGVEYENEGEWQHEEQERAALQRVPNRARRCNSAVLALNDRAIDLLRTEARHLHTLHPELVCDRTCTHD